MLCKENIFTKEHLKALSHDIRTIISTLRAGRSYHAPLIEKVDWNEAWAAVERANITRRGAIATRDVHTVTLVRYDDGYRVM